MFLITFVGCTKEIPETIIEGKVINAGSKQPVDSVLVTLQDGVNGGDSFFGSSNTAGSKTQQNTYTNKDGAFKISIKSNSPYLSLTKIGYEFIVMDGGAGQSIKYYQSGKVYSNEILGIWASAYFNPILKGKNCTAKDSICFGDGIFSNFFSLRGYGNGPLKPYGGKGLSAFGDAFFRYWIKSQIRGTWHERIDSVYIKSFTTYTDTIYY